MEIPAPTTEVALVGSDDRSQELHRDLEGLCDDRNLRFVAGEPAVVGAETELVVAIGDEALSAVARRSVAVAILPVECGAGIPSSSITDAGGDLRSVLESGGPAGELPTLAVAIDGTTDRAVVDVALVTEEPARISEFSVRSGHETVARLRADGIVVATPVGSRRYARAAGGPTLDDEVEAAVVVPIAPFVTRRERWVLSPSELSLVVERDDYDVSVQIDGVVRTTVDASSTVAIDAGPTISVVDVDGLAES